MTTIPLLARPGFVLYFVSTRYSINGVGRGFSGMDLSKVSGLAAGLASIFLCQILHNRASYINSGFHS